MQQITYLLLKRNSSKAWNSLFLNLLKKPISDENRGVPDVCCSYIPWHWKHIGIWFVLVLSWGPSISSQRVQEVGYSSVPNRQKCLDKHKCVLTLLPLGFAEPTSQWANFPSYFFFLSETKGKNDQSPPKLLVFCCRLVMLSSFKKNYGYKI